jgi:hypothetical protein
MFYIENLCMNFHKYFIMQKKIINIVEDCPVCNKTKNIIILQCGHSVCKDCIIPTCMLCKTNEIMERI